MYPFLSPMLFCHSLFTVSVTYYIPRYRFLPLSLPDVIELFCKYPFPACNNHLVITRWGTDKVFGFLKLFFMHVARHTRLEGHFKVWATIRFFFQGPLPLYSLGWNRVTPYTVHMDVGFRYHQSEAWLVEEKALHPNFYEAIMVMWSVLLEGFGTFCTFCWGAVVFEKRVNNVTVSGDKNYFSFNIFNGTVTASGKNSWFVAHTLKWPSGLVCLGTCKQFFFLKELLQNWAQFCT